MKEDPQFGRPLFQKWTAVFFVLVMAGFGFVQAVHVHDALTSQSAPASHCSLCVVAHSAALITRILHCAGTRHRVGADCAAGPAASVPASNRFLVYSSSPAKPLIDAEFPSTIGSRFIDSRLVAIYRKTLSGDASYLRCNGSGNSYWRLRCFVGATLQDGAQSFSPAGFAGTGRQLGIARCRMAAAAYPLCQSPSSVWALRQQRKRADLGKFIAERRRRRSDRRGGAGRDCRNS